MSEPERGLWLRAAAAAAAVAALAALFLNARHYHPFISDDAFISFRYAQRLLGGDGLTWTDGAPVEGYTNLLWTLLCAGLGALGMGLVAAGRALGFLGVGAALLAILWAVAPRRPIEVGAALVGMLGLALSGPAGAWVVGGLEQPLVAALFAWALATCRPLLAPEPVSRRQIAAPGALLALLALTRADGAVLVAAVCLGVLLLHRLRRPGWERALLLAALPALAFAAQLGFRLVYYDAWVPNSALVKVAFTAERLASGTAYVLAAAGASALLLAAGALPLAAGARRRGPRFRLACLAWIAALVWAGYVLFVGGDIFPAHRHWLPVLAAVSLAAALGLAELAEVPGRRGWIPLAAGLAAVIGFAALQPGDRENHRAVTERWEYNGEVIGRMLRRAFGERRPLLAAATVGSLCYYAELPALDMLGLNDRHIARHRPADFGTGFVGHELGDGVYAMSRRPDLVVFCGPTGRARPCSRGEIEMAALPEFARLYQLVKFRGAEPFSAAARIWVRRDGPIGIETSAGAASIPGYLLAGERSVAELDRQGRIGLRMPAGAGGQVELPLAPGRWTVRAESDADAACALAVTNLATGVTEEAGAGSVAVALDAAEGSEARVRVAVRASRRLHLRRLIIERAP